MNDSPKQKQVLSAEDVKILKDADTVVPRYTASNGQHVLEVSREARGREVNEHRYVVPCDRGIIQSYANRKQSDIVTLDAVYLYVRYDPVWKTVKNLIRKGDVLALDWLIGNASPVMMEHGFFQDQVALIITRPGAKPKSYRIPIAEMIANNSQSSFARYV